MPLTTTSILSTVGPLETRIKEQINLFTADVGGEILPVFLETVFNSVLTEYQMQLEQNEDECEEDSQILGDDGPTVGFDIEEMLEQEDRPIAVDNRTKGHSGSPQHMCLFTQRNKKE